jgi:hypothetical protein
MSLKSLLGSLQSRRSMVQRECSIEINCKGPKPERK